MAYIQKDTQIKKVQLNELSRSAHICIPNRHITRTPASIRLNKPFVLEKRSHGSFCFTIPTTGYSGKG